MAATRDQLEDLARAICAMLRAPGVGWPNPFRIHLYPHVIPEDVIEDLNDALEDEDGYGFAGRPGGPLGKNIRGGHLEVALDERGCVYSISVTGGQKKGLSAPMRRVTVSTDWEQV